MKNFLNYLEGKKTEILASVVALIALLQVFNVIDISQVQLESLLAFFGSLIALSFGARVKRLGRQLLKGEK